MEHPTKPKVGPLELNTFAPWDWAAGAPRVWHKTQPLGHGTTAPRLKFKGKVVAGKRGTEPNTFFRSKYPEGSPRAEQRKSPDFLKTTEGAFWWSSGGHCQKPQQKEIQCIKYVFHSPPGWGPHLISVAFNPVNPKSASLFMSAETQRLPDELQGSQPTQAAWRTRRAEPGFLSWVVQGSW